MKRTVSIPVNLPHERFLPLMGFCADIFNQHVDWALRQRTYNRNKAHKALYADLRLQYPNVPSALLQTIRDNAMEALGILRGYTDLLKAQQTVLGKASV